jgi:hypothetical protein
LTPSNVSVAPGWYWFDFPTEETPQWTAFTRANKGAIWPRRNWATNGWIAQVFQVTRPIVWGMGGRPTVAPRGPATELRDMAKAPDPSPGFVVMVEQLMNMPFEAFRDLGKKVQETANQANTALLVLLWGGAAILLLNLFRNTAPAEEATADA